MRDLIIGIAEKISDVLMNIPRYPQPSAQNPIPKIVAHRGAWDLGECRENSLRAFQRARELGAWAVEFDVRFSLDGIPVIVHDTDLWRTHRMQGNILDLTSAKLCALTPPVATLDQVLAIRDLHFMIEIKTNLSDSEITGLAEKLKHLKPVINYHLLTLSHERVRLHPAFPKEAWILVSEINPDEIIAKCEAMDLGGVACHYLFMNKARIDRLKRAGRQVGVGFIPTRNVFNREWNLGVDWVFTNDLFQIVPH
jgi:glycerophosphoryl diester phosphodiesterase